MKCALPIIMIMPIGWDLNPGPLTFQEIGVTILLQRLLAQVCDQHTVNVVFMIFVT